MADIFGGIASKLRDIDEARRVQQETGLSFEAAMEVVRARQSVEAPTGAPAPRSIVPAAPAPPTGGSGGIPAPGPVPSSDGGIFVQQTPPSFQDMQRELQRKQLEDLQRPLPQTRQDFLNPRQQFQEEGGAFSGVPGLRQPNQGPGFVPDVPSRIVDEQRIKLGEPARAGSKPSPTNIPPTVTVPDAAPSYVPTYNPRYAPNFALDAFEMMPKANLSLQGIDDFGALPPAMNMLAQPFRVPQQQPQPVIQPPASPAARQPRRQAAPAGLTGAQALSRLRAGQPVSNTERQRAIQASSSASERRALSGDLSDRIRNRGNRRTGFAASRSRNDRGPSRGSGSISNRSGGRFN